MQDEKDFIKDLINPKTQNVAFQKLVQNFQKPLYNHIRNIVLNHDDADDVLQNTFIKVFQYLKDFKGESKLFSWIYRIATNEAITFINNRAKRNGISSQEVQTKILENLQSDVYFDGNEIEMKLQNAINGLPEKQQLVFKMRYYEEIKYEDMSEILGTSVGALKASFHIASKKIEDFIKTN